MVRGMINSHTEEEMVEKVVVDDIVCNKCGGTCKDESDMNFEGLLEVTVCGGYASLLGDGKAHTFSICEYCLRDMFKTFKFPPKIG